jgi:plastocyanin
MRRGIVLAGLSVAVLLGAGCSEDRRSPTAEELRGGDTTPDHVIRVDGDGFEPDDLTVGPGDIVEVVNDGDDVHSLSSGSRVDTGAMEPGESVTLILREAGEIEFTDRVGDTGNGGRIVVAGAAP